MARLLYSVFALTLVLGVLSTASADSRDKRVRAQHHERQSKTLLRAKKYRLAIAEMTASNALVPQNKLLYNIGLAHWYLKEHNKALAYFRSYVQRAPKGRGAEQARRYIEKILIRQRAATRDSAQRLRRDADAHMAGKRFRQAYEYYRKSYWAFRQPELHYEMGEVKRAMEDVNKALWHYRIYIDELPKGAHIDAARARVRELEARAADASARVKLRLGIADGHETPARATPGTSTTPNVSAATNDTPPSSKRVWLWVATGVAAIAGGLAFDLIPERNGKFDAADLVPLGLYGAGATLVLVGVF